MNCSVFSIAKRLSFILFKIFIQDGRFGVCIYIYKYNIHIHTKYIKTTAFQTSPVEKERNKRLNLTFQQQIAGRK